MHLIELPFFNFATSCVTVMDITNYILKLSSVACDSSDCILVSDCFLVVHVFRSKYGSYNKPSQYCSKCNDCDGLISRCILQVVRTNSALRPPNTVHCRTSLDKYVENPARHVLYEIAEVFVFDTK